MNTPTFKQLSNLKSTGYRPKIAEFTLESLVDYKTTATSLSNIEQSTSVENDRLFKMKLAVPIKLKGKTKMGLQLKYYNQRFNLDEDNLSNDADLFHYLNSESFVNTGLRFIYKRDLSETQCLTLVAGSELRSDHLRWSNNSSLYFISGSYIKEVNSRKKIGVGLYAAQSLGVFSVYPLFIYEKRLSDRWTMDLLLPKSATFRYKVNEKTFVSAVAALRGWRYNLTNAVPTSGQEFTLRRSDAQFTLMYEREIHDWLWFGLETGYNRNLNYVLTNPGERSRDALTRLSAKDATFLKFSLFIVPPKKLWNKM
ncbi:MAG: DUF6268 family outer membrane beta-barrel protein [Bacteroidota bacterium]